MMTAQLLETREFGERKYELWRDAPRRRTVVCTDQDHRRSLVTVYWPWMYYVVEKNGVDPATLRVFASLEPMTRMDDDGFVIPYNVHAFSDGRVCLGTAAVDVAIGRIDPIEAFWNTTFDSCLASGVVIPVGVPLTSVTHCLTGDHSPVDELAQALARYQRARRWLAPLWRRVTFIGLPLFIWVLSAVLYYMNGDVPWLQIGIAEVVGVVYGYMMLKGAARGALDLHPGRMLSILALTAVLGPVGFLIPVVLSGFCRYNPEI